MDNQGAVVTPDGFVNVVNQEGQVFSIPQNQIAAALDQNFRIASPQEVNQHFEREEYTTPGASALAGLAGAARSASLGLSDLALVKSGAVDPETLQKLETYNPVPSKVGEVGGIAAGLVAGTGEAGLLRQAARIGTAPMRGAIELGELAGKAAESLAPQALGTIATSALKGLASGAAEGAAFGAGSAVTDYALGDPDLNAQKALSHVTLGALLGGGVGGALGATAKAVPLTIEKARNSIAKVFGAAEGVESPGLLARAYAKTSAFVSGKPEEDIVEAITKRREILRSPEEKAKMAQDFIESLNTQYRDVSKASFDATNVLKPKEIESVLKDVSPVLPRQIFDETIGEVEKTIDLMRREPDLFPAHYPRQLELIRDRIKGSLNAESTSFDIFNALEDLKRTVRKDIKFGKIPAASDLSAQQAIKGLSSTIKESLENGNIWGEAAASQSAFNDVANSFLFQKENFQKTFMKKVPTKSGGVTYKVDPRKINSFFAEIDRASGIEKADMLRDWMNASAELVSTFENLSNKYSSTSLRPQELQNLLTRNQQVIDESLRKAELTKTLGILEAGAHNTYLGEGMALLGGSTVSPMIGIGIQSLNMLRNPGLFINRLKQVDVFIDHFDNAMASLMKGVKHVELPARLTAIISAHQDKSYDEKAKQITALAQNPKMLASVLTDQLSPLQAEMPNISQSMLNNAINDVSFLYQKLPKPKNPQFLDPKWKPSPAQISKFNKYYEAVNNPLTAISQIKKATLSMETVEALKATKPQLYEHMKQQLKAMLVHDEMKKLNNRQIQALSLFMGEPLQTNQLQPVMAANQATFMQINAGRAAEQQSLMGQATPARMDKLEMAKNYGSRTDRGPVKREV